MSPPTRPSSLRRLRRALSAALTAASLALFVATAVVWLGHASTVAGYVLHEWGVRHPVVIGLTSEPGPAVTQDAPIPDHSARWTALRSADGGIQFQRFDPARPGPVTGPKYLTAAYAQWERPLVARNVVARRWGFEYVRWAEVYTSIHHGGRQLDLTAFTGYESTWTVPYGFVLAVAAVLPTRLVATRWLGRCRAAARRRLGLCPACGYDLRATPPGGRCPECGGGTEAGDP